MRILNDFEGENDGYEGNIITLAIKMRSMQPPFF